jgi:hypothetical protein
VVPVPDVADVDVSVEVDDDDDDEAVVVDEDELRSPGLSGGTFRY